MGRIHSIRYLALIAALLGTNPPVLASGGADHRPAAARTSQPKVLDASQDDDERPLPVGVFRAGKDVATPAVLWQAGPFYTSEAMRNEVQGIVRLDCVVGIDGTVGDVRVVRSLDRLYGLDDAAVAAAKQWKFEPAMKYGVPVPALVTIDMTFAMSTQVKSSREKR